jgi:hypothetical protein
MPTLLAAPQAQKIRALLLRRSDRFREHVYVWEGPSATIDSFTWMYILVDTSEAIYE